MTSAEVVINWPDGYVYTILTVDENHRGRIRMQPCLAQIDIIVSIYMYVCMKQ